MEIHSFLLYLSLLLLLFTLLSSVLFKKTRFSQTIPKIPPGSMGWPYFGETHQLYSQDPMAFFADKQKRYGDVFKSHILGYNCVMLASPEAVRFVLVNNAHLFKPTYPESKMKMIGPSALFFHQGEYHTQIRKLVQIALSPDSIRKLIPDIEHLAISASESWANSGHVINTYLEMKKFAFDVGILSIFGRLHRNYREKLSENYGILEKGYNCFPTYIPGTAYYEALRARKRLNQIVSEIIIERKEKRLVERDLLANLLSFKDGKGQTLREDQIADNIIGVLFAAQDTTASLLTWILKYLHDDPKLFEAVKAEQIRLLESRDGGKESSLTWTKTRHMPLTYRVIMESLRMANIIPFTFREAVVDVEYKGYKIPKGWKVMPIFRSLHHNSEFFSHPHIFDPSRFEVVPKPNTFMPFGNGVHACPGNELAKLEILILIHHLVTNFRWEVVGPQNGIQYCPFPLPQNGLPSRFWKESRSPRK